MPGQSEDSVDLALLARAQPVHEHSDVSRVDAVGKPRRQFPELRALRSEELERVERDNRSTLSGHFYLVWTDTDPIHLSIEAMRPWFRPNSTDADHRFEVPRPHAAHAVVDSELARLIGIAVVSPLVDQRPH